MVISARPREAWPDTAFDGLDLSERLELAKEHGRINQGHRGFFRDLAGKLDQYDVVSMFHYLEHTTEPRAELAAAHQVLRPGGHLVIEVPDPESPMGRVFGRRWAGWLQPQHLNMIPIGNLREALSQLGFTVLREQRAEAHDQNECVSWVALLLHGGIPGLDWPWRPNPPSRFLRAFRTASLVMSLPVLVAARLTDVAVAPIVRRAGAANVYRVVARKNTLRHAI
jgi:SAM-dependent methyltransferase